MFKSERGISQVALTITIFILLILVVFVLIVISRRNNTVFYDNENDTINSITNEETPADNRITEYPIDENTIDNLMS